MANTIQSVPTGAPPAVPQAPVPITRAQTAALYVGDLNPEVTEALLFEHFAVVGPIASIRVCRDAVTRRSLGYAYVNFQNPADAERALDTLNFSPINERPCRIMWCQRDPSKRRSGVGNIFIKNLDKTIDHKELLEAFSVFGNVTSVKIVLDETGQSAGRGFVNFETAEEAEKAIQGANNTMLKDKQIYVDHFKSRKDRMDEYAKTEHNFKNVFVKNLAEDVDEDELKNLFSAHGVITSHIVVRENNKSRGFGFVNFAEFDQAKAAVEAFNGKEYKGKVLYAGRAQKKSERRNILARETENRRRSLKDRTKDVNLYVKNLSENVDDAQLRTLFEEFGAITSARVMKDERGTSRGFGFVCFSEPAEATRAVSEMNARLIENKPLYVALAQSKEERRQTLAQLHRQRMAAQRGGMNPYMQGMFPPQMFGGYNQGFPQQGFMQPYGRFPPGAPRFGGPQQGQQFYGQPQPYGNRGPQQFRQNRPGPNNGQGRFNAGPQQGYPRGPRQGPGAQYGAQPRNDQNALALTQAPVSQASGIQQLAAALASAEPERQKQILGDHLYQIISTIYPAQAGKLTGMLLQMDNSDLLHLIEDNNALRAEVEKANEVLSSQA